MNRRHGASRSFSHLPVSNSDNVGGSGCRESRREAARSRGIPRWKRTEPRPAKQASRSPFWRWPWPASSPLRQPKPSASPTMEALLPTGACRLTRSIPKANTSALRTARWSIACRRSFAVLFLLILWAGLGFPAVAADNQTVAHFKYSTSRIEGNLTFEPQYLFKFIMDDGAGSFHWRLNASNITVNVTRWDFVEVGRPSDPSQMYARVATGPPSSYEHDYSYAVANSTSRSNASIIESLQPNDETPQLVSAEGMFSFQPKIESADDAFPHASQHAPANATWARQDTGRVVASGNFSIRVIDAEIHVQNQTERKAYESGNWTSEIGPGLPAQPNIVREFHQQLVRLDVTDAVLELVTVDRPIAYAAERFTLAGNMTGFFSDASGMITKNGESSKIQERAWELTGRINLDTWKSVADGGVLKARLEANPEVFGLQPPATSNDYSGNPVALPNAESRRTLGVITIPVLAVLSVLGFAVYRRNHPPQIEDVELALLTRNPRRARSLARRIVRLNPKHPNAVFLYGAALLALGRYADLVRTIEPLALKIPAHRRTGTAFVLAVAAGKMGDAIKARRWKSEAQKESLLATELQRRVGPAVTRTVAGMQTGYS